MTAQLATIQPRTDMAAHQPANHNGMLNPQNIAEALQIADVMSKSNIVPKDYQGNPGNIVVAIQWGMELGLPPLQAMQNLAVINGRPSLWGDAVIALVRGSGLMEYMREDVTDDSATCTVKRKGEPETSRSFSKEDAKRAGLSGKQGPWTQYPKRMMQMRARSWALRDVFPDVLKGIAVAEEAQDMPVERDMGAAEVISDDQPAPASRAASVKAKLAAKRAPAETLPQVLSAIAAADTPAALAAIADRAAKLEGDDKSAARKAWTERKRALEATDQPAETAEPDDALTLAAILAAIEAANDVADVEGWQDAARDADLTDAERQQVQAAADARREKLTG